MTDWLERRRRDPSEAAAVLNTSSKERSEGNAENDHDTLAPGLRALWDRLTEVMMRELWGDAPSRRRWSRPYRTEAAVRNLSSRLGWYAALHLDSTVPLEPPVAVIEDSVRWQMRDYEPGDKRVYFDRPIGRTLGWFIKHRPTRVQGLFGAIIGNVERRMEIPRAVTIESLRGSIELDGNFDDKDQLREFLDLALPAEH